MQPTNEKRFRVLIAENDSIMGQLIEELLREMGIRHIVRARTGDLAYQAYRRRPKDFDLIVSDWSIPELDGLDLLKRIREQDRDLPFLMITARAAIESVKEAAAAGVTAYIAKPFTTLELQRKMESILQVTIEREVRAGGVG